MNDRVVRRMPRYEDIRGRTHRLTKVQWVYLDTVWLSGAFRVLFAERGEWHQHCGDRLRELFHRRTDFREAFRAFASRVGQWELRL